MVIDQLGHAVLKLDADKDHLSTNTQMIITEKVKCEGCLESMQMIINMKAKEAVKAKIFPKGDEPIFEWFQGIQFKTEMLIAAEQGMQQTERTFQEEITRSLELLKGLHAKSQSSGTGQAIVGVEKMKKSFSDYVGKLVLEASQHQDKVSDLQQLSGEIYIAMKEMLERIAVIKDLTREHAKWLIQHSHVQIP
jgi:hypothetical protein